MAQLTAAPRFWLGNSLKSTNSSIRPTWCFQVSPSPQGVFVSQVSPHSSTAISEHRCCWQPWGPCCPGCLLSTSSLQGAKTQKERSSEWDPPRDHLHMYGMHTRKESLWGTSNPQGHHGNWANERPHGPSQCVLTEVLLVSCTCCPIKHF